MSVVKNPKPPLRVFVRWRGGGQGVGKEGHTAGRAWAGRVRAWLGKQVLSGAALRPPAV